MIFDKFNKTIRGLLQTQDRRTVFYPCAGTIAKVSVYEDSIHSEKTCFILKVHPGCMGDYYTVFVSTDFPEVMVDNVHPESLLKSFWFFIKNFKKKEHLINQ